MISCTDFIPAYSELFTYLEEKAGRAEVERFWQYLFKPSDDGIPLIKHVEKEGIKGCFTYWAGSLNEEAADFTMYLNEKAGWFMIKMHHCPSKGRLLELASTHGIVPYPAYCLHCDHYRAAIEQVGLQYLYDFTGTDCAACQIIITDPNVFDGRIIIDSDTVVMDRRANDNKYFHKEFHSSMNMGIAYIGEKYGIAGTKEFLTQYAEKLYRGLIQDIRQNGLCALENEIRSIYEREQAPDAIEFINDSNTLTVKVKYCPATTYLKSTGRQVSPWYCYTTETVMETLARNTGLHFKMKFYNEATGAAEYCFEK